MLPHQDYGSLRRLPSGWNQCFCRKRNNMLLPPQVLRATPFVASPGIRGTFSGPESTVTEVHDGELICAVSRLGKWSSIVWGLLLGPVLLAAWWLNALPEPVTQSSVGKGALLVVVAVSIRGLFFSCLARRSVTFCPQRRTVTSNSRFGDRSCSHWGEAIGGRHRRTVLVVRSINCEVNIG